MSDSKQSFRRAFQARRFPLAAVLLAQVVEARHVALSPVVLMQVQRRCMDLLEQRDGQDADALLRVAETYVPSVS
ncbi:hypothetical protein [Hymenobacter crusticola]|uniref:hypothetical protein n=1 Tax=Hymenobacter crusticola TaxID=1770526 RepID=UPI001179FC5F|nr:hypothetical protein [Hymenobacter crusticola]